MTVRYHTVSGGIGSWVAAHVDMLSHPSADHRFIFADTLYEDADCYRFLIEGVAALLKRKIEWRVPSADDFPDYRVSGEFDIATYAGHSPWREFLGDLRRRTASALPELIWLVEGRDPWEVFRDHRFLGNSRIDPCSKSLKRVMLDGYRDEHCDRSSSVFTVGIGPHEAHRFNGRTGSSKKGLRQRMAELGWAYEAPLLTAWQGELPFHPLKEAGIERPRLYKLGYMHNNCGGFCIKAGHAHYLNRLRQQPERFAYDAMMESKLAAYIGKPVSLLTDRSGDGTKKLLTLDSFALGVGAQTEFDYSPGTSGCGCMIDDDEVAA